MSLAQPMANVMSAHQAREATPVDFALLAFTLEVGNHTGNLCKD